MSSFSQVGSSRYIHRLQHRPNGLKVQRSVGLYPAVVAPVYELYWCLTVAGSHQRHTQILESLQDILNQLYIAVSHSSSRELDSSKDNRTITLSTVVSEYSIIY